MTGLDLQDPGVKDRSVFDLLRNVVAAVASFFARRCCDVEPLGAEAMQLRLPQFGRIRHTLYAAVSSLGDEPLDGREVLERVQEQPAMLEGAPLVFRAQSVAAPTPDV